MDESTAGAGEVVAAAILANKRGDVVGERSYGAGVELGTFNLHDGGAMLITVAKYAPPTGKPFMEEGVTPTVEVKQQAEVVVPEDDSDSEEAPQPNGAEPKTAPKAAPKPVEDLQLKKAIEILKTGAPAAAAKAA
jgi:carboxyl-terminal processing protease